MYLVSFHHVSTILEKLGWKSFITLTTHNSGGIFYPSSGISLLVQASILIFLIRVFLSSFNSCMSSCNPLMESLRSVTVCYLFSCSPKIGHCSQCIKQLPNFGSWKTLFSHLLLGVSLLHKAEFFSCPGLLSLLKNEAALSSDNENHLIPLLEIIQCTNLCVKMSWNVIIKVRKINQWYCRS